MMQRTTTQKLHNALSNNLLTIEKAEIYHKSTRQTNAIEAEKFKESFDFLCESEIFLECIGWHYEAVIKENGCYIAECGRMDGGADIIVIAHLRVNKGVNVEDVDKALNVDEEE